MFEIFEIRAGGFDDPRELGCLVVDADGFDEGFGAEVVRINLSGQRCGRENADEHFFDFI